MRLTLENGLPDILTKRRIPSASAFARRLEPYLGKRLSTSQITRYMHDATPAFDRKFVEAACNVLRCLPTDLYRIRIDCEPDEDLADFGPLPKLVDVVRTTRGPASASNPVPPERKGGESSATRQSSGDAKRSKETRRAVQESIHSGPQAHVFPFRKK